MNKKVLDALAETLSIDAKLLAQSLASEDEAQTIELPKLFKESEVESIREHLGKEKYDEGARVSREKTLKDLSDLAGFEERIKDKEGFIKAFEQKIKSDSSIEPNQKVEELQNSLKKLQGVISDKEQAILDLENGFKQKETNLKLKTLINVPESIGLTKDEATSLFLLTHEIKEDGIYKGGVKLKNDVEAPLDLENAVSNFITEKGWDKAPTPTGRGGGSGNPNPKPNTFNSLDDFEREVKSRGINVGSEEYNALLKETAKENPEILN